VSCLADKARIFKNSTCDVIATAIWPQKARYESPWTRIGSQKWHYNLKRARAPCSIGRGRHPEPQYNGNQSVIRLKSRVNATISPIMGTRIQALDQAAAMTKPASDARAAVAA